MEILDGVEVRAARHELGQPGKQQVGFMAHIALERPARPPLERLEPPPELRGLGLGDDTDREDATSSRYCSIWAGVRHFGSNPRDSSEQGANRITTNPRRGATLHCGCREFSVQMMPGSSYWIPV